MTTRPPPADRVETVRLLERQRVRDEVRAELFGVAAMPTQVGRFVLRRKLGAGAAGVVYAAHDPKLEREVAIKLIVTGGSDEAGLLAEARALARFSHPNLLPVYEVGVHDGVPFIVSELLGGSLRGWLTTTHAPDEALALVIATARGIAEAHRRGLVHRDLKPENVLVGGDGRPRVADFGLARAFEAPAEGGALPGTPAYMSPEHLAGELADPRSDQYSFCMLAFEVLYGRYPTERERSAIPADHPHARVWPVLQRGLAPQPDARWPGMDPLVTALEAHARVPRRVPVALLAGAATVTAAAIAAAVWIATRPAPAPSRTPEQIDQARYTAVAPLLQAGKYAECADALAKTGVATAELRWIWLECAKVSMSPPRLDVLCDDWARASPDTVPPECSRGLRRAHALAAQGLMRACRFQLYLLPPSKEGLLLLSRCVADDMTDAEKRGVCIYSRRLDGHPTPFTACGYDPREPP